MSGVEIAYAGQLAEAGFGEDDDALFLRDGSADEGEPLARRLQDALDLHGRRITVRYYMTDEPRSAEQLLENEIRTLAGDATADYTQRYSEYTGYLWTDEEIDVGGHDLLAELSDNIGRYLHMSIAFHTAAHH